MLSGDFMPCEYDIHNPAGAVCINPDTTRTLLEYIPGAHQLLPSWEYYDLVTTDHYPFVVLNTKDRKQTVIGYDQFDNALHSRYHSPDDPNSPYPSRVLFMQNNNKVFGNQIFSDWRGGDNTHVTYYILYGEGQVANTIGQVRENIEYNQQNVQKPIFKIVSALGDSTVPLISSTRKGNGLDLNGPATLLRFKQRNAEEDVLHAHLTTNPRVQNCI